jgi:pimeloyl-ACP methyl ester carboxylesterase
MQPRHHTLPYLLAGAYYRLAFTAWGDTHAQPVICVHGLTRQGRDFDILAQSLSDSFYVICPDLPGRGASDWLPDPMLYQAPSYIQALSHLLAFIDRKVHWVGTSLGGICGMMIAAAPNNAIDRLVLNDIGPFLPKAALERIAAYVGQFPSFDDVAGLEAALRQVHAPFGELTDTQWAAMAEHSSRKTADGRIVAHYDPGLAAPMRASPPADIDMWVYWDRITVPMLALRGESSDLLLPETLDRMKAKSATHTVPNTGHAPALMDEPTIAVIRSFLAQARG